MYRSGTDEFRKPWKEAAMLRLVSALLVVSVGCAPSESGSPVLASRGDTGDTAMARPDVADAADGWSPPDSRIDSGPTADSGSATDSTKPTDTGVATLCPTGVLPPDGGACALDINEYCRLSSCSNGCEGECRCKDGQWSCGPGPTCRDKYGCGTPPSCRDTPCP